MPAITIESLPTLVYEQLMQAAALHQRNLIQEIVTRLEHSCFIPPSVSTPPRHLEAIIADARASRTLMKGHIVTAEELDLAKTAGRL
jgi:hypothetical protein